MKDVFVIGDIHGEIQQFEELLRHWDKDTQQLIITGDLIDRGKDPLAVVRLAMKLKQDQNAIVLMGNHEEMLLSWLDNPNEDYFFPDSVSTITSFLREVSEFYWQTHLPEVSKEKILTTFPEEVAFLRNMSHFHETDTHIFVHAGVDVELLDWKETSVVDMHWIREDFHKGVNNTGKIIVFGHTPTRLLHHYLASDNSVWVSPDKTKIGIDGGAYFGGLLHGLSIKDTHHNVISIDKDQISHKKDVF